MAPQRLAESPFIAGDPEVNRTRTPQSFPAAIHAAPPLYSPARGLALALVAALAATSTFAQPANDDCLTPTPITGSGPFTFDMNGAAFTPGPACGTDIAHDVWFCWTASCDGAITITTCGGTTLDTVIEIYQGCGCPSSVVPNPDLLCCNDDAPSIPGTPGCAPQSEVTCNVACGQQYMIRIADRNFNGALGSGNGSFRILCPIPCPPPQPPVCEDCCAATPRFSGFPGTVAGVTQERSSGDPLLVDHAFDLIDISNQGSAPLGTNWCAAPFYLPSVAQGWRTQDIGTVFGVTLDDDGNIYLTHTSIYGPNVVFGFPNHDVLGSRAPAGQGAGAIYKISTSTGVSSHLVTLPNFLEASPATKFVNVPPVSELYPGLGNICFDCRSKSLYVSNFEDGRVYRITKTGTILETYDHATGAITPWGGSAPEPADPHGWCPLGERVWAVGVNQGRLYYSIWAEDRDAFFGGTNRVAPNYAVSNEIWSIAVTPSGAITGVAQLEITMPASTDPGMGNVSNPVSDLSFTDDCCMLVAERSMHDDSSSGAHTARMLKYCQDAAGAWTLSPDQYLTASGAPNSVAGGVAFDPNQSAVEQVWGTCDAMGNGAADCAGGALVYGFAGFPISGGSTYTNAIHVDIDRNTSAFDKFALGSIDVSCVKCASIQEETILCDIGPNGPTGTYSYTFCLTNNSGVPVHYLLYPTLVPHVVWIAQNGPWMPSETRCFTVTLTGNPGDEICFPLLLADQHVEECCTIELCATLPDCDCIQFPTCDITCDPATGGYNISVSIQNLEYSPSGHLFVIPEPAGSGVTVSPDYLPLTIPLWGTAGPLNFAVTAPPGFEQVCLRFTIHTPNLAECCSKVKCFELPLCDVSPLMPCDSNCDTIVSVSDIGAFVMALTNPALYATTYPGCPLSNSDTNYDGFVTVSDIGPFVASLVNP